MRIHFRNYYGSARNNALNLCFGELGPSFHDKHKGKIWDILRMFSIPHHVVCAIGQVLSTVSRDDIADVIVVRVNHSGVLL